MAATLSAVFWYPIRFTLSLKWLFKDKIAFRTIAVAVEKEIAPDWRGKSLTIILLNYLF